MGWLNALRVVALAVRFGLELGAVWALGHWGFQLGTSLPTRIFGAVFVVAAVILVWGCFIAPRASVPWSQQVRNVLGLVVFLVAATALWATRDERVAIAFAAIAVADTALLLAGRW